MSIVSMHTCAGRAARMIGCGILFKHCIWLVVWSFIYIYRHTVYTNTNIYTIIAVACMPNWQQLCTCTLKQLAAILIVLNHSNWIKLNRIQRVSCFVRSVGPNPNPNANNLHQHYSFLGYIDLHPWKNKECSNNDRSIYTELKQLADSDREHWWPCCKGPAACWPAVTGRRPPSWFIEQPACLFII